MADLLEACKKNDTELAFQLIAEGADINIQDKHGYTPLLWACCRNNQEIAHKLIEAGANVNASNINGGTPLYWACEFNNQGIIQKLIMHGAIPDYTLKNVKRQQPFIESIRWSYKVHTEWSPYIKDTIKTVLMIARLYL